MEKLKQYSPILILASVVLLILAPNLFSDGMFMDGTIYAALSKNLAAGIGSFWQPHLSETLYPEFYQHPPLAFGLEALLFKLFGNSFLIERFYSLSTYVISGILISILWLQIGKPKKQIWVPLLFWLANPLILWAISNNMLENTLNIFILLALIFIFKSLQKNSFLWILFAGFSLFLGLLTKGLVALFPLSFFFWYSIFEKKIALRKMIFKTSLLIFSTFIPLLLLILFSSSAENALVHYINKQLIFSLTQVQTVPTRFFIIYRLFNELLLDMTLVGLFVFIFKKRGTRLKSNLSKNKSSIFLFLALGFSAVLPITISLKQSGFYILPSFAFFAIAFALFVSSLIEMKKIQFTSKILKYSGPISLLVLILAFAFSLSFKNKTGRDQEILHDVYSIIQYLPQNERLAIPKSLSQNWPLQAYFARYSGISLDDVSKQNLPYYLTKKTSALVKNENYQEVNLKLKQYKLYQLINP